MINTNESYWTAFYTKPRNEKKAAQRLEHKGFNVYCPTRTVLKQWSDRKKRVTEPVFSSYLFAKVSESERIEVLRDSGIVSNVHWLGKPAVIRDSEIVNIKSFLEENPMAEAVSLSKGDSINVNSGVLAGQRGVIERVRGNRATLSISSLGIQLQAEVGLTHLQKVG